MSRKQASVATQRLGLGARPDDIRRIASDPEGYVLASLRDPAAAMLPGSGLGTSAGNYFAFRQSFDRLKQELRNGPAVRRPMADSSVSGEGAMSSGQGDSMMAGQPALLAHRSLRRRLYIDEVNARISRAVTTDNPFVERLVMFWSNHFCIAAIKPLVQCMAGAYEREAIRPHVLGRFSDMLRSVEQHPAMLNYLDNTRSVGPNSRVGRRRGRGLNENLAREILELHTVGVNGGYTQTDVTSFARILTGWSVVGPKSRNRSPGTFVFKQAIHEPGDQTVMGRRYRNEGVRTGVRVLDDLARHPSTAGFIARKLASHFVSDNPSPALIRRLERTFLDTGGDLRAVSIALIESDEVWRAPPSKVIPPYDFIVSMMRGLDVAAPPLRPVHLLKRLGQPIWMPPSPKGWPDGNDDWAGPSAIRERLRIASRVARIAKQRSNPSVVAKQILGPDLSSYARQVIDRAQSPAQGFELLIMSPAFQRR